jgi:hypothetical protein
MCHLTTEVRSEKCIVRYFPLSERERLYLHKTRQYSPLHTYAIWYSLLLLGYKPVQHVTVLNTVGSCNTTVNIVILYSVFGKLLCIYKRCWKWCPRASNTEPVSLNFSLSLRAALRWGTGVAGNFSTNCSCTKSLYRVLERRIQQEKHGPQLKEP